MLTGVVYSHILLSHENAFTFTFKLAISDDHTKAQFHRDIVINYILK